MCCGGGDGEEWICLAFYARLAWNLPWRFSLGFWLCWVGGCLYMCACIILGCIVIPLGLARGGWEVKGVRG